MDCLISFLFIFVLILSFTQSIGSSKNLTDSEAAEKSALAEWERGVTNKSAAIESGLISEAIRNGWWVFAVELVKYAQQTEGFDVSGEVRSVIADVKHQANSVLKLLKEPSEQLQTVSPAFQWAEADDKIYIQVKLAVRWSSPGALVVHKMNVTIAVDHVFFSCIGEHSDISKFYKLDLKLHLTIVPDESDYSWGGVGKLLVTLKKEKPEIWGVLQDKNEAKISNSHIWWEMKDKIEQDKKMKEKIEQDRVAKLKEEKQMEEENKSKKTSEENEGLTAATPAAENQQQLEKQKRIEAAADANSTVVKNAEKKKASKEEL